MPPNAPATDPEAGSFFANCLNALVSPDAANNLVDLIKTVLPFPAYTTLHVAASGIPAWYFAAHDGYWYVFVSGLQNADSVGTVMDAYGSSAVDTTEPVVNSWFDQVASGIFNQIGALGLNPPTSIWLAGHSAGGAIVEVMAPLFIRYTSRQGVPKVVTFGAPRPGNVGFARVVNSSVDLCRWMNDLDPVPLVPLRVSDSALVLAIYGWIKSRRFGLYLSPGLGFSVNQVGGVLESAVPDVAVASPSSSIVTWLTDWMFGSPNSHNIAEYARRMRLVAALAAPTPLARTPPRDAPEHAERRAAERAAEILGRSVFLVEHAQNAAVLSIPHAARAHAVRRLRVWYVVFNGQTVFTAGSKRRARLLSRQFNSFLDTIQTTPVVDIPGFILQMQSYLGSASEQGGNFSPVMNTSIP